MKTIIYIVFLVSIFLHELGHLIVSKIFGMKFKIKFTLLGFYNKSIKLENVQKYKEILIFVAGPLCNVLIAFIFLFIDCKFQELIVLTNLFLGMLNILPIIPLDGGNILICILRYKLDIKDSINISLIISKVFLVILSFVYCIFILIIKNLWLLILLFYLWYLYIMEEKKFDIYLKIKRNIIENKFI